MAKFTPGIVISEIRGKFAATIFTKNRAGAMIRNRVTPINRRSLSQSMVRQEFSSISTTWRSLSQAQRDAWIAATPNFPYQDTLGQTKLLSGSQLYEQFNRNLLVIGAAQITTPPLPTSFSVLTFGAITLSAAAFTVGFTPDPVEADRELVVYATRPVSAGVDAFRNSDFRFVQSFTAAQVSPADINSAYEAIFGTKTGLVGQKIGVQIKLVEISSGIASTPLRTAALIA